MGPRSDAPVVLHLPARPRGGGLSTAGETIAAVDLGSNSFHMIVARVERGVPHVVDRLRERVALAEGLDGDNRLTEASQDRALACIRQFGQRLAALGPKSVRAVGTNALRVARNGRAFLRRAASALGHPIEVISGPEEARLIYLGVAKGLPAGEGRRLVVDIGGGSTECILGERFETIQTDSLYMGCISWTQEFFPRGEIRRSGMERAEMAARLEIEPIERRYRTLGWDAVIGSSGTILSIADVLRENGWSDEGITRKGLSKLRKAVLSARSTDRLRLEGLKEERAGVLPGGLAILRAAFEGFGIRRMQVSEGALREGLLYDLLGRIRHEDVREQTIAAFLRRYQVDLEHAAGVERTALALLGQVGPGSDLADEEARRLLAWAARLHELGISVSYAGHHKHGAYLVANSDMRGFSRQDQAVLSALIRGHRRRIPEDAFQDLPEPWDHRALLLTLLLRLAVRLNRNRSPRPPHAPRLVAREGLLSLTFAKGWLDHHPMTRADLEEEAAYFDEVGVRLSFR